MAEKIAQSCRRDCFVTVSSWAKEIGWLKAACAVPHDRIEVVENFLSPHATCDASEERGPYMQNGIRRGLVVSRLDAAKRVDVLVDALEHSTPELPRYFISRSGIGSGNETAGRSRLKKKISTSNSPTSAH